MIYWKGYHMVAPNELLRHTPSDTIYKFNILKIKWIIKQDFVLSQEQHSLVFKDLQSLLWREEPAATTQGGKKEFTLIVWQVGKRLTPSVLSQLFTIVRGVLSVCVWRGCAPMCGGDWGFFCVCKCSLPRCQITDMLYLSFISLIYSKSQKVACGSLKPNTFMYHHFCSSG